MPNNTKARMDKLTLSELLEAVKQWEEETARLLEKSAEVIAELKEMDTK